jgi:eukaryotic translation initiation factor 2C
MYYTEDRPLDSQMEALAISRPQQNRTISSSNTDKRVAVQMTGHGGSSARTIELLANHFLVNYEEFTCIYHYEVTIQSSTNKEPSQSDLLTIRNELNKLGIFAYDGKRNLYSTTKLTRNDFEVTIGSMKRYAVTLKFIKFLNLEGLSPLPVHREVLQSLDIIVKDASRLYARNNIICQEAIKLLNGALAIPVFHQTLKYTKQGLSLCVDYSVMPFHRSGPVLDYIENVLNIDYRKGLNNQVEGVIYQALKGLKVTLTHRKTNQKFTVHGLTTSPADQITFQDAKTNQQRKLVKYYKDNYNQDIKYPELPCLDLSKGMKNYVPMEFCSIDAFQKFPKGEMHPEAEKQLRIFNLASPDRRLEMILKLIKHENGPCRYVFLTSEL